MGVVIVAVECVVIDFNQRILRGAFVAGSVAMLQFFIWPPRGKGSGVQGVQVNEFSGVVTDIREESRVAGRQRWQMALDRTEFVAGNIGMLEAVARSGAKLVVPVLGVVMDAA